MPNFQLVLRDPETLLSIIYNPSIRDPSEITSYEYCRLQIDDARDDETIDQEKHDELIARLNRTRRICIIYNLNTISFNS